MTSTKCLTCQIQAKREAGEPVSAQELNHWMLWGCTCDPEVAADAAAYMDRITR